MQDQRKENYFPAGVAPKILAVGAIEAMLRIGPMLSETYTDTWLLWLASLTILAASTVLTPAQLSTRIVVFGAGLLLATLGGVYLFESRVGGILGGLIGYTTGSMFLFTSHVLANKDLDSFNDSPPSIFGSAGGIIMILIAILAFIFTAMRFSAVSGLS
jgi:hypothetical protein